MCNEKSRSLFYIYFCLRNEKNIEGGTESGNNATLSAPLRALREIF